jgi:hypothetical protein
MGTVKGKLTRPAHDQMRGVNGSELGKFGRAQQPPIEEGRKLLSVHGMTQQSLYIK